jgi:hypothetical protein
MPHRRKGPAGANRRSFYKIKLTYPIVPSLPTETKCFLRQLAMVYREAMTAKDPRVMRLGILWRHLRENLQAEAE